MNLDTIGKGIKKYRLAKKLRQEDLAEKVGLSANYIGMVERGEKTPSLESFISVLADVLNTGYTVKSSLLNERMSKISKEDRERVYDVIETLLKHSKITKV